MTDGSRSKKSTECGDNMTEKNDYELALEQDEFEIEPDEQKHRIRGRIAKINRDAVKKLVTMTIKVYEPYIDQNNEQRENYEDFVILFNTAYGNFSNPEGVNVLDQCDLGYKVECRYRQKSFYSYGMQRMNLATYLQIIDKRFIPAKFRKKKAEKAVEEKTMYKQKKKKTYGFEEEK